MSILKPNRMNRNKVELRNRHWWMAALCLGLFLIAGTSGVAGNGLNWVKVSGNGRLVLQVDPDYGICKISDREQQQEWISLTPPGTKTNEYWMLAYRSAFIIRYVTNDNTMKDIFSGDPSCIRRFSVVKPGVCRFTFHFPNLRIGFSAEYSLGTDNNLRVNVPFNAIVDPKKRLLSVRFLPYLEALPYRSNGYVVLPDGCGGIKRPNYQMTSFEPVRIYGERFSWSSQPVSGTKNWQRSLNVNDYRHARNSFYNLPLFGVVYTDSAGQSRGMMGVISRGQFQAEIGTQVTPQGLLSVSPRLIIREVAYDMFGRLHAGPVFTYVDRTVDYYFFTGNKASYVGMARKYRQLLITSRKAGSRKKGPVLRDLGSNGYTTTGYQQTGYRLQLFMGVAQTYHDTENLLCVTSFSQAENILKDLHHHGVRHLQVVLVGWTKRGLLGDNPRHFPPDPKFGGYGGLKKLVATAKALGFGIGLMIDNTSSFRNGHGFNRSDTVKDIQGVPVVVNPGQNEYLLCPKAAHKYFQRNIGKPLRNLQLNGIFIFDGFDRGSFNCYDPRHPIGGKAFADSILGQIRSVSSPKQIGATAAFDFLMEDVAAFYNLPAGCSDNCDEAIPLTPMIFHGLVPYSFGPINLRRDESREFLRMIEYGGVPGAFLTATTVSELKNAKYNPLFSGKYLDWRSAVLREYRIYQRDLRHFQPKTIMDHRCLAPDVYATIYDDQSAIIVNYRPDSFIYRGITVKPQQFVIIKSGAF